MFSDPPPAQSGPSSGISVKTDSGQEDTATEKLIQQELQSGSDENLGPPGRPPTFPWAATKF